jgi:hypothetical protein
MKLLLGAVGRGFTKTAGLMKLDLADTESVSANIAELRPDVILVPGSVTAVDWCETHRDEAGRICVDGSRAIQAMADASARSSPTSPPTTFFRAERARTARTPRPALSVFHLPADWLK